MALTYTPAARLGSKMPDFQLPAVDGQPVNANDFAAAKVFVVMFICNHCPYVKAIEDRLLDLARRLSPEGAQFIAICANDPVEYPEDSPQELLRRSREKQYPFPYLWDEDQSVARTFGAVCTPDFFVYDRDRALTYRGRLDDSWKDPAKVQKRELEQAVRNALQGTDPVAEQTPSMGCSIKWREEARS